MDEEEKQRTRINLSTINDPDCQAVLEKYERAQVDVAVWDTTTDIGIPSFLCTITDRLDDPLHLLFSTSGMGCHPSRKIALLRALTEAAQSRLTFIVGSRDDAIRSKYEHSRSPDILRHYRAQLALNNGLRDFNELPDWQGETLNEDVTWELDRLRSVGIEQVVAVDLTKLEFGLPVIRVVVPGLEGTDHAPGYSPGVRANALTGSRQ
jgi:ribosomal protein S12 methylthiotransferase accessory factor